MFLSYFNKLKTFFILPEKAESNELTASDRSAFSLLSLIFEAKRLKNNLIDGVQKKLKTFFILPEKAESNELTASDRSAFSLLSLIFEAKRLKNNLIDGVQKSVSRY